MNDFFTKLEPADIIAAIGIIGGFILMSQGIDTVIGGIVSLIAGYYFGHKRQIEDNEITYEKIKEE